MIKYSLKELFKTALKEIARDKNGDVIREECANGEYKLLTRNDLIIDKCISRAERGDMYAMKLIVDLCEPKELRIAVQSAITVEHKLNDVLQSIVDKLVIMDNKPELPANTLSVVHQNDGCPPAGDTRLSSIDDKAITMTSKLEESQEIDISEGGAKT